MAETPQPPAAESQTNQRTLLLALDSSEDDTTAKVLDYTLANILKPGDRVVLFSSFPYSPDPGFAIGPAYAEIWKEQLNSYNELRAVRIKGLQSIKANFPEGYKVDIEVDHREPTEAIDQAIKDLKPDLVVIGRRHLSSLERVFSSTSVSKHLLLHSPTPILVVK